MKKLSITFFLFLFFAFSLLCSGVIDSQDGFQYLAVARNIYYKGTPTAPVYEYNIQKNIHMSTYVGKDGNTYSSTGLGYSLAMVPAVFLTDIVYKIYHISPPVHFPLESDWLTLLLASFTNAFFGAVLGVVLFYYFLTLKIPRKASLFLSFITLFCTNLLVYTRDSFAHMMFITLLVLSFYFLKRFSQTRNKGYLLLSGLFFGMNSITYNLTFLLPLPAFTIYYLLLLRPKFNIFAFKENIVRLLYFIIGAVTFGIVYFWFERLRIQPGLDLASTSVFVSSGSSLLHVPIGVFLEGIYGQLFSPGRSIFIYSPILLTLIIFWPKIRREIKPEFLTFLVLSLVYLVFYASQYSVGDTQRGIASLWHGESSWGPRYLTPLIPFGMLVVGGIFIELKKKAKGYIFYPLLAMGFFVELLGIIMPYQVQFVGMQDHFFLNGTEYTSYLYTNLLPRYSPIFVMSKHLIKLAQSLPKTVNHGQYNVRFYDGIDFPFNVGPERWRVIQETGYISFDNSLKNRVKQISFALINQPIEESSNSAQINFVLNGHALTQPQILLINQRKIFTFPINSNILQTKNNQLVVATNFFSPVKTIVDVSGKKDNPAQYSNKNVSPSRNPTQIIGLIAFSINDSPVNFETLDFPYLSPLGPAMTGAHYQSFQTYDKDPWKSWDIHTQIYERVPDFWWAKLLYYWDIPRKVIAGFFIVNIMLVILFGLKLKKVLKHL